MIKATDPEFKIQTDFIRQVELHYPDLLYTISPAGFIMSAGMAMKMIRMGYRKGTYDWLCFEPRGRFHGIFIEFKRPGGKTSDEQIAFRDHARRRGYFCCLTSDATGAFEILTAYLALPSALEVADSDTAIDLSVL